MRIGAGSVTLLSTLNDDMKTAMKAKDKETLQVIRMLKASIQNEQIKKGADLNEEEELTVLSREMKQRRDSLTEFEKADRTDLAEKVKGEIAIVEKYLPAQLDEAEIRQIVAGAIEKTGASSPKEFGKVMGAVMPQVKGKADGNQVNAIVKELLGQM
nr:GatB/YqeY domain-containing protein [Enterococcus gallinarum]